jgi:diacylglycerol kinase (ATP)
MSQNGSIDKETLRYQLATFGFAFNGLKVFFYAEIKSRIHLFFAIVALVLGILLKIPSTDWIAIAFAVGLVFIAEIFNSALERLVDQVSPEVTKWAGLVKDYSAAAVLIASITALTVGLIVFIPKIFLLL